jgi:arsenic resistance protein ArsH
MPKESVLSDLPNILPDALHIPEPSKLSAPRSTHRPRILLLHGSLRKVSYSRLLTQEATARAFRGGNPHLRSSRIAAA